MPEFENLVQGQMEIMDKLLYLQAEIERCQEIEKELMALEKKPSYYQFGKTSPKNEEISPLFRICFKNRRNRSYRLTKKSKPKVYLYRFPEKRAIPGPEWLFYFHFLFSTVIINKRTVGQAM